MLVRPPRARFLYVLAHGAGAGMRHPFMEGLVEALAAFRIATWRYEFPYMAAGRRRIDAALVLEETVRANVAAAARAAPRLPIIAGGKSMGGRMTSRAQAGAPLEGVRGLAFVGFPLHPAGAPGVARAEHLAAVRAPMLFLQGSRDALCRLDLLRPVLAGLGQRAELHVVDGADHGFHVRRSSGRTDDDVRRELADTVAAWAEGL